MTVEKLITTDCDNGTFFHRENFCDIIINSNNHFYNAIQA